MFIDNLGHQVRRSQRAGAKQGKMFSLPYGYRIKIKNGREVSGERVIHCDEAKIVKIIFNMYADGHSLGSIVHVLNAKGILSPRKSKWTKQSLFGSRVRREGILNNEIYRGKIIWNMKSKHINPSTGGINYFMNPVEDWVVTKNESLRIIPEELWKKCDSRKFPTTKIKKKKRITNPLKNIIFCGVCNGNKTLADRKRYVCTSSRRNKTCTNGRGTQFNRIIDDLFNFLFNKLNLASEKKINLIFKNDIFDEGKINELLLEKEDVSQKINNLVKVMESQSSQIDELSSRLGELNGRRVSLTNKISDLRNQFNENDFLPFLNKSLNELYFDLMKKQENDFCALCLEILINKIILTPTRTRSGEFIEFEMQSNAWLNYYRLLKDQQSESSR